MNNLKLNIIEWGERLINATYHNINNEYLFFFDKIDKNKTIQSILLLAINKNNIESSFIESNCIYLFEHDNKYIKYNDIEHSAASLYLLNKLFIKKNYEGRALCRNLGCTKIFDENLKIFFNCYIRPILSYIYDKLDDANLSIYLLEKYKKRTEWFLHQSLKEKYDLASKLYENIFDDDLRLFLFDQGIEYPFSTPKSPSGRTDIVGQLESNDPLVLEIKIYDSAKGYGKNRIIEGFSQIVQYTKDYSKNIGFLVVFNLDQIEIKIVSDDSDNSFSHKINFNNKVYYIVIVNLNFDNSASNLGKLDVESITQDELTKSII